MTLTEEDKLTFHRIIGDTVQHFADARACGMKIPLWLQKQGEAIFLIESDPVRGMAMLADGLQDECDCLRGLLYGN